MTTGTDGGWHIAGAVVVGDGVTALSQAAQADVLLCFLALCFSLRLKSLMFNWNGNGKKPENLFFQPKWVEPEVRLSILAMSTG